MATDRPMRILEENCSAVFILKKIKDRIPKTQSLRD
jgi:hypothetical protein